MNGTHENPQKIGNGLIVMLMVFSSFAVMDLSANAIESGSAAHGGLRASNPNGTNIIINEFATRGPGSAYDEFVELYNPSGDTINISGWKLEYFGGTAWATHVTIPENTSIPAGAYYLIANGRSDGFNATENGVTPDLTFSGGIADGSTGNPRGLRLNDTSAGNGTFLIVDTVVYGGDGDRHHTEAEDNSTAPGHTTGSANNLSVQCTDFADTDNNSADFSVSAQRSPRGSGYSGNGDDEYIPRILYVAKYGNDSSGNGSAAHPYLTIGKAMEEANDTDTIRVFEGVYEENVVVNRSVEIIGNGSGETVIEGVGDGEVGLSIMGHHNTTGEARGIVISGDYAYVADGDNGLVVLDITDRSAPWRIGGYDTNGTANAVAVSGDHAYVADRENGLVILDISNRSNPRPEGRFDGAVKAYDVVVDGDYAYVADDYNGFIIVNISNGSDPQQTGHYDTDGYTRGIVLDAKYAYLADGGNGLVILDISDRSDPQFVGDYETSRYASGLDVADEYAYMVVGSDGIEVVDVTEKSIPRYEGHYDSEGWTYDIEIAGDIAYVADYENGLLVLDVSDTGDIRELEHLETRGETWEVEPTDGYAYLADGSNGLVIANAYSPPRGAMQLAAHHSGLTGITIRNGSAAGIRIDADNVEISDCTITENTDGISVVNGSTDVEIHDCLIFNNTDYGISAAQNDNMTVNATDNYWGAASGPYHPTKNPGGDGDNITDHVEFDPWVKGISGTERVTNNNTGAKYFTIQDAVDEASEGDVIFVDSGTFRENVPVNEAVSLEGNGSDAAIIDGGGRRAAVVNITADDVSISGLAIRSGSRAGVHIEGNGVIVENCSMSGSGEGIHIRATDLMIENCNISGNHDGIRIEGTGIGMPGKEVWNDTFGGGQDDTLYHAAPTSDGGFILTGSTRSYGGGDEDVWLVKIDANGEKKWDRVFEKSSSDFDVGYHVLQASDGGYLVTGASRGGPGWCGVWLIKTDSDGIVEWQKGFGGNEADRAHCALETPDGGYVAAGYTKSMGDRNHGDAYIVKVNSTGALEWEKDYGGSGTKEIIYSMAMIPGEGFVFAGVTERVGMEDEVYVLKTDLDGNRLWDEHYGGALDDRAYTVVTVTDGSCLVGGRYGTHDSGDQLYLLELNTDGDVVDSRLFGGTGDEGCRDIEVSTDGGLLLAGYTTSRGSGGSDMWLVKVDGNMDEEWNMTAGGTNDDSCQEAVITGDKLDIFGHSKSFGGSDRDFWALEMPLAADIDIRDCTIANNTGSGVSTSVIRAVTIANNTLRGNGGAALRMVDSGGNTITDNIFTDNGNGIALVNETNTAIENCEFSNNSISLSVESSDRIDIGNSTFAPGDDRTDVRINDSAGIRFTASPFLTHNVTNSSVDCLEYLRVRVKDARDEPHGNASVKIFVDDGLVVEESTGGDGLTGWHLLTYRTFGTASERAGRGDGRGDGERGAEGDRGGGGDGGAGENQAVSNVTVTVEGIQRTRTVNMSTSHEEIFTFYTTYHVNGTSGSDDNNGSAAAPFATIGKALSAAEEDDVIAVAAGTYNEALAVDTRVTLVGEGRDTTIIDGGYADWVFTVNAGGTVLEGFTFRNGRNGVTIPADGVEIVNCRITGIRGEDGGDGEDGLDGGPGDNAVALALTGDGTRVSGTVISNIRGGDGGDGTTFLFWSGRGGDAGSAFGLYLGNGADSDVLTNLSISDIAGGDGGRGRGSKRGGYGGHAFAVYGDTSAACGFYSPQLSSVTGGSEGQNGNAADGSPFHFYLKDSAFYVENGTFDESLVGFENSGTLEVAWYLTLRFENETGAPVDDVELSVFDSGRTRIFGSDSTDDTVTLAVTEYISTESGTAYFTPHIIQARNGARGIGNVTGIEADGTMSITIVLGQLPELHPVEIGLSNETPEQGDILDITVELENSGNVDAGNFTVSLWDGAELLAEWEISLDARNSTNLTFNGWRARGGPHALRCVVDMADRVPEYSELNNTLVRIVDVADWVVTGTETYADERITVYGNITIEPGGRLVLSNVTLAFDCLYDGEFHIEVLNPGELETRDGTVFTTTDDSHAFNFMAVGGSEIVIDNTTFINCGHEFGQYGELAGVYVETGEFEITNSVFHDCYTGLVLHRTGTGTVDNITVYDCDLGLYIEAPSDQIIIGNSTVFDCTGELTAVDAGVFTYDVSLENEDVTAAGSAVVSRNWYLDVTAFELDGNGEHAAPAQGVECSIADGNGSPVFEGLTDETGSVPVMVLEGMRHDESGRTDREYELFLYDRRIGINETSFTITGNLEMDAGMEWIHYDLEVGFDGASHDHVTDAEAKASGKLYFTVNVTSFGRDDDVISVSVKEDGGAAVSLDRNNLALRYLENGSFVVEVTLPGTALAGELYSILVNVTSSGKDGNEGSDRGGGNEGKDREEGNEESDRGGGNEGAGHTGNLHEDLWINITTLITHDLEISIEHPDVLYPGFDELFGVIVANNGNDDMRIHVESTVLPGDFHINEERLSVMIDGGDRHEFRFYIWTDDFMEPGTYEIGFHIYSDDGVFHENLSVEIEVEHLYGMVFTSTIPPDTLTIVPGGAGNFSVELENLGSWYSNVTLEITPMGPADGFSWPSASVDEPVVMLGIESGSAVEIPVKISVPAKTMPGFHEFNLTARDESGLQVNRTLVVAIPVVEGISVEVVQPAAGAVPEGGRFTIELKNNGNDPVNITLDLVLPANVSATLFAPSGNISLSPFSSKLVEIAVSEVTILNDEEYPGSHVRIPVNVSISAPSHYGGSLSANATISVEVIKEVQRGISVEPLEGEIVGRYLYNLYPVRVINTGGMGETVELSVWGHELMQVELPFESCRLEPGESVIVVLVMHVSPVNKHGAWLSANFSATTPDGGLNETTALAAPPRLGITDFGFHPYHYDLEGDPGHALEWFVLGEDEEELLSDARSFETGRIRLYDDLALEYLTGFAAGRPPAGNYLVGVVATGDHGLQDITVMEVSVTRNLAPTIVLRTYPDFSGGEGRPRLHKGDTIIFDASGTTDMDSGIAEFRWEIGTGNGAAQVLYGPVVGYEITRKGDISYRLTVTDEFGESSERSGILNSGEEFRYESGEPDDDGTMRLSIMVILITLILLVTGITIYLGARGMKSRERLGNEIAELELRKQELMKKVDGQRNTCFMPAGKPGPVREDDFRPPDAGNKPGNDEIGNTGDDAGDKPGNDAGEKEVKREMIQEIIREMMHEINREMMQETNREMMQETNREMIQEIIREMMQETNREMMQETNREMMQETNREMMQETNREMIQEKNREMMK